MKQLLIVADRNIPEVESAFSRHAKVILVDGRRLSPEQVQHADALIVRSVTRVNQDLLEESKVSFVGSATIGTDHVDLDYLASRKITFSNAPGCNATSAAEYVIAAVLEIAESKQIQLAGKMAGVVGNGNVGSRVVEKLSALGCDVKVFDPPREQKLHDREYASWEEITRCDIISAHVPLTRDGDYPTYQMFDRQFFESLQENTLFINTSRGAAVDEKALKERVYSNRSIYLALDVWQKEPEIDLELLEHCLLSTPHIAGYSREGKYRGLQMVYDAACLHFDIKPEWGMQEVLPELKQVLPIVDDNISIQSAILKLVRIAYDIRRDDHDLRKIQHLPAAERGQYFDRLRKDYPVRREFYNYRLRRQENNEQLLKMATGLGFGVTS